MATTSTKVCCEGCGALAGEGYLEIRLRSFRGHRICEHCIKSWKAFDKWLGREATWEEFLNPRPSMWGWKGV